MSQPMAEGPKVLSFEQLISRFEQPISEYMDGSVRTDDTMSGDTREESACCHCMMEHTEQQRCQFQIIARFHLFSFAGQVALSPSAK